MPIPRNWQRSFATFLSPCLNTFTHVRQRACLPNYLRGLLAPPERKSAEPMAMYVHLPFQRLHHFLKVSLWTTDDLERLLAERAQSLCGGPNGVLIIDDTGLPKSGPHSVGVAHQYCGALCKLVNCQALVTLTLADPRVFAPLGMRLFLPKSWTDDPERCRATGVLERRVTFHSESDLALAKLDRVRRLGVTFRIVLADAGYGISKAFRQALTSRGLTWAVETVGHQRLFGLNVQWKTSRWVAVRACLAGGAEDAQGRHLPGDAVWVIGEKCRGGVVKYYLANHPPIWSKGDEPWGYDGRKNIVLLPPC